MSENDAIAIPLPAARQFRLRNLSAKQWQAFQQRERDNLRIVPGANSATVRLRRGNQWFSVYRLVQ